MPQYEQKSTEELLEDSRKIGRTKEEGEKSPEQSEAVQESEKKSMREIGQEKKAALTEKGKSVWEKVKGGMSKGAAWLREKAGKAGEAVTDYAIAMSTPEGAEKVGEKIGKVGERYENVLGKTAEKITNIPGAIQRGAEKAGGAIGKVAEKYEAGLDNLAQRGTQAKDRFCERVRGAKGKFCDRCNKLALKGVDIILSMDEKEASDELKRRMEKARKAKERADAMQAALNQIRDEREAIAEILTRKKGQKVEAAQNTQKAAA